MKRRMKVPIDVKDVCRLLETNQIPEYMRKKLVFVSNNLADFYIGFNKINIGEEGSISYKTIVKNVYIISKNIVLPVKRNNIIYRGWLTDRIPDKVVIVLDTSEEYFVLDEIERSSYLLMGIFDKEDFIRQKNNLDTVDNDYDEFTSFIEDRKEEYNEQNFGNTEQFN